MTTKCLENRVSVKVKSPNPLFEKWLEEWRDEAKERNSKTQHAYSLALKSLRKYPLPLDTGKDCNILKGFGHKLCERLDDTLKKYKKGENIPIRNGGSNPLSGKTSISKNKEPKKVKQTSNRRRTFENEQVYMPACKSGAYAILLTLYRASLESNYNGFMLKKDLIRAAQPFCNASFTRPDPGSYYTAWSCMKTLLEKKLVKKESSPAKFSLTTEGNILGSKINSQAKDDDTSTVSSFTSQSSKVQVSSRNPNAVSSSSEDERVEIVEYNTPLIVPIVEEGKLIASGSSSSIKNNEDSNAKKRKNNLASDYQDVILAPLSFDIILYVDTQEIMGGLVDPKDDPLLSELIHLNVYYEVRNLKVGDYCWIFRDRKSKVELVSPYIIERKRMDDLASSIKDGRFYEQKFRLSQCGLQNVIYMIEQYGKKDEHLGLPLSSLHQAAINTLVQDRFLVKYVDGIKGVAEYLACMSNLIRKYYMNKTIASCPKENTTKISITDDLIFLMTFNEFNKCSTKAKAFTVKDMFIKMLLQIKGLSIEKAMAIVAVYPTPRALREAFVENQTKGAKLISSIKYGNRNRNIGPALGNAIHYFFTKESWS